MTGSPSSTPRGRRWATYLRLLFAGCALFSGAALLGHILVGARLPAVLAALAVFVLMVIAVAWRRTPLALRPLLRRATRIGATAGILATIAYDGSKAIFSRLDQTHYNPFETIRVFGVLLSGSANPSIAYPVGAAYHLLNGTAFGVAFCLLLGRRGVVAGIAWGLGLEFFQLWLYPDWLGIRLYGEFVQYSVLGHVVYGTVLGTTTRRLFGPRPSGMGSARAASERPSGKRESAP